MKRLIPILLCAASAFGQTSTNDNRGAIVPSTTGAYTITTTGTGTTLASNPTFSLNSGAAGRDVSMRLYDGTNAWYVDMLSNALIYSQLVAGVATERMRLTSTGLGIGGAPTAGKLEVIGSANVSLIGERFVGSGTGFHGLEMSNTTGGLYMGVEGSGGGGLCPGSPAYASVLCAWGTGTSLVLGTAATARMTLDSSGNIGIGAVPSGKLDVSGIVRSTSIAGAPSSGAGAEMYWNGTTGGIQTYNRGAAAFTPLTLSGSTITFNRNGPGGAGDITVATDGSVSLSGTVNTYGGVATAARGIPAILGSVSLTAQGAAIAATNLLTSPPAGMYRVCFFHEVTQAATTSSSTQLTLTFTSAAAGWNLPQSALTNTLGANTNGCVAIRVQSGNVTYSTSYSSAGATAMQYGLNITAERLQ